jgi:endoglucanase
LQHFKTVRAAGFKSVRFALLAFQYMDDRGRLDKRWLTWLDARVDAALGAGLTVIIDEHDSVICGQDPSACGRKLDAYWTTIARRYRSKSNRLMFEILNEPHSKMTSDAWNAQLKKSLTIIRASNPTRNVLVDTYAWSSIRTLPSLALPPSDRHIIVSIHYYLPFNFTHQAAFWIPSTKNVSGVRWGSESDKKAVEADMNFAQNWAKENNRPINIGEFGTYNKSQLQDRIEWTSEVTGAARSRGFSWIYWDFQFDSFSSSEEAFIAKLGGAPILEALLPK